jgi:hypothetical protein
MKRSLALLLAFGLVASLSCVDLAGAATKQEEFKTWITKVDKFTTLYLANAAKVKGEAVAFAANRSPAALDSLATGIAVDASGLIASVALAPSHRLKVDTLNFAKEVNDVGADVLFLTEPQLVATLTMAKTTVIAMNKAIAVGNVLVADAQKWKSANG